MSPKGLNKKVGGSGWLKAGGAALALIILSSCGPVISKETLRSIDRKVQFGDLIKDPDLFNGTLVILGGEIIQTHNAADMTWIEILHRPLGNNDRPNRDAPSGGRFMVRHEGFLDPAVYHPGRMITIAGPVEGKRVQLLGEIEYTYPLIADKEHLLWDREREPRFYFGLTGSTRF